MRPSNPGRSIHGKEGGRKPNTISSYFRKIFTNHPEWLHQKSNNDVLARYRSDHGLAAGKDVEPRIRNALANLKSQMRKEQRDGGTLVVVAARVGPRSAAGMSHRMEQLEEQIDECLSTAKLLDPEGLKNVIRCLRSARNEIVWKLGQP